MEDLVYKEATSLRTSVNMTHDPDLEVLRVAAAKAQDAAMKYQTQTTSLCRSRSSSPHSSTKDHYEIRSTLVEHHHEMDEAKGFEPAKEKDNDPCEGGSREHALNPSAIMLLDHHSSPGDSALGESLSGDEEVVCQPGLTCLPSIVEATKPTADSSSNTRPELISQQQSLDPLLPHGVFIGPDPFITGENTIEAETNYARTISKSIDEPRLKGKELMGLVVPKVSQDEFLHKPKPISQKPKRPVQVKPLRLPENAANSVAFEPSDRRSLSMSAQSVHQSRNGRIQRGSNISHHEQENTSQRDRPFSRSDDISFVQVFKAVVYPNIKASADWYKNRFSNVSSDDLFRIGKSVANEVVTKDFQNWVRENSYKLSSEQQKEVKEFVGASFSRRVALISRSPAVQDDDISRSSRIKSGKKATSNGLSLDPFAPSSSQISSRIHASHDLSLLGPGQISESTPTSVQTCNADDLSLLGPGQMPRLIDPLTGLDKWATQERPFSKPNSHDHSPGTFQDITLALTPLSSNNRKFDSTTLIDKEKRNVSGSARLHAQRKKLSGGKSRTSKNPTRVSPLEVMGDRGDDMNASVLSPDGKPTPCESLLSKDKLSPRQQQSNVETACHIECNDSFTMINSKNGVRKPTGKGRTTQTLARANENSSPFVVDDTSSSEDGEKVLAAWLSLNSTIMNPPPGPKVLNGSSESSFCSSMGADDIIKTSSKIKPAATRLGQAPRGSVNANLQKKKMRADDRIENYSKITPSGNRHGQAPRGAVNTKFQKKKVRELVSAHNTSVDAGDLVCASNDQLKLLSNVSDPPAVKKSTSAIRESVPRLIVRLKMPRKTPTTSRSKHLRSRPKTVSSQVQPDALNGVISRGTLSATVNPSVEQTAAELASNCSDFYRPYRSDEQRAVYVSDSHEPLRHVDFVDEECEALLHAIHELQNLDFNTDTSVPIRTRLRKMTQEYSYEQITELIDHVYADTKGVLRNRKRKGIRAFLSDLGNGLVSDFPGFVWVEKEVVDPAQKPQRSLAALLRYREVGLDSKGGRFRNVQSELRVKTSQKISPWRSWKSASGDVVTCAWAPKSLNYAVGAAAPSNNEDLQYNRPHNLLLGNLNSNIIQELPDHRLERPRPDMVPDGPNSSREMYNNLDPMIYLTVTSVQFSREGSKLITASHDKTAKIWDVPSSGTASCLRTLHHDTIVTGLDVSPHYNGLFATASKSVEDPIRVYFSESFEVDCSKLSSVKFSSPRAKRKREWELYPECLRWGKTPNTKHILLAGFQQWSEGESEGHCREGDICLWDVGQEESIGLSPSRLGVLTAAWHPTWDLFAVGGVPGSGTTLSSKTTKSVVRTWDMRNLKRYAMEYECPALDMQDVTFNPHYQNIVTAGCTDSITYVWDFRRPEQVLLKLQHDKPLMEWDHRRDQEEADPGVMMTLWGLESSHLYTGSSDGIVKCWDTSRAPEDALVRDVADLGAGIQCGAFSPDFSHLLVGDADGVVHVLTSAPVDQWHNYADADDNVPAVEPIKLIEAQDPNRPKGNEGILAARKLLQTGQLVLNKSYGVGQGPNYSGPYARYARMKGTDPAVTELLPQFDAMQPFSRYGQKRRELARRIEGVIHGRKELIAQAYESTISAPTTKIIKHEGRVKKQGKRARSCDKESETTPKRVKMEIIDLTHLFADDGSALLSSPSRSCGQSRKNMVEACSSSPSKRIYSSLSSRENPIEVSSDSDSAVHMVKDEASSENDPLAGSN